jgi:class 3 adenylate cyclase
MKATNIPFSIEASDARMRSILELTDSAFAETEQIPTSGRLTYENGFYVECAAVFIDIRGSSGLTAKHTQAVLGKMYRAYISECVAVLNQDPNCGEIFIQGDCVGAVFHAPRDEDVDSVFVRAGELNSLIEHLNWRLDQRGYPALKCGIGMSAGRALMIQAGYKGSGINDVIWMGDVVNDAAKLCHLGNRGENRPAQVSRSAFSRLSAQNRKLLTAFSPVFLGPSHYQGNFVSREIAQWTAQQRGDKENALTWLIASLAPAEELGPLRKVSSWL